jgi:hypothetical protein
MTIGSCDFDLFDKMENAKAEMDTKLNPSHI